MNDPEDFLTRWSRRKRAVADDSDRAPSDEQARRTPDAPPVERAPIDPSPPPADAGSTPLEPAFDLTKLPPIETITAETDITVFFAPGVPADLRLAALRRAWVVDPKVRDFVGLNDYDFDFHTPGAIPGFGPLQMTDELRQEVVRIVSAWEQQPETTGTPSAAQSDRTADLATPSVQPAAAIDELNAQAKTGAAASDDGAAPVAQAQDELISPEATTQRNTDDVASQQAQSPPKNLQTLARRGHGRALPQ